MTQSLIEPSTKRETRREIARLDPLGTVSPFGLTFGRLFDDFWGRRQFDDGDRLIAPAIDVLEDDDQFVVSTELPGLGKEDVRIQYENGVLAISGEKKFASDRKEKSYHRMERSYGSFYRAITLPAGVNVEAVDAAMKDGVLEIRLPKREESKPKVVKVK